MSREAEEIADIVFQCCHPEQSSLVCRFCIAQALTEFASEARSEALEGCAKIAETCIKPEDCQSESHDIRWCSWCENYRDAGEFIANKIRSLIKPTEER